MHGGRRIRACSCSVALWQRKPAICKALSSPCARPLRWRRTGAPVCWNWPCCWRARTSFRKRWRSPKGWPCSNPGTCRCWPAWWISPTARGTPRWPCATCAGAWRWCPAMLNFDPGFLGGQVKACIAAGKPAQAQESCTALLAQAPEDPVCQYYAQLAGGQTPDRQPAELVRPLFDELAESYDQHMVRSLKYQLPRQVADKIITRHPDKKINVLDLGCGTGLLGVCLGRLDGFLIGVDLSMKMLEQAARHQLYDRFHTVNLHDALRATPPGLYQVIAALDVFIYAGELSLAIADAHRILTADGLLILSCETASETGPDLVLLPAGRYAHKRSHVQALCQAAGFDGVGIEDRVLSYENRQPVAGFVVSHHEA